MYGNIILSVLVQSSDTAIRWNTNIVCTSDIVLSARRKENYRI